MKTKKRVPDKVQDAIGDRDEILLKTETGPVYPCEPEFVGNGVILHNTRRTHVFKYTEMLEILKDEHERFSTTPEMLD